MRTEHPFHRRDVLRVLEPREDVQVVLRLDQGPARTNQPVSFLLPCLFISPCSSRTSGLSFKKQTYSVSSTFLVVARCAKIAIMRARASERLMECTFWNSPSLRSEVASSSPPTCSRALEVGEPSGMVTRGECYVFGGGRGS